MPTLGRRLRVLYMGFVSVVSKFGFLTPLLAGIGKLLNTSNISTVKIVGVVALSA